MRPRDRRARRPGRRRARRARHARWPRAAGPRTAATCWRCWPGSTRDGCARYVVTDVSRDGTLPGPNLDLLREVCAAHRPAGRRQRRRLQPGRPARARRAGARRRRGRDRRQGAVRRARSRWTEALEAVARMIDAARSRAEPRGSRSSATRRAVAAGDHVWVTGCTSTVDGDVVHEGDPSAQTAQAIATSAAALERARRDAGRRGAHPHVRHRHRPAGRRTAGRTARRSAASCRPRRWSQVVAADRPADAGRGRGRAPTSRAVGARRMTVAVRVIPCLDVDAGRVVKGVNFIDLRDAGDPVEMAAVYDAEGADELAFLDITASSGGRETTYDVVRRTAEQVFIPLTVGGGVRTRRRRRPAAARRRGQGRGEHRRDRPAGAASREIAAAVRLAGAGAVRRRPARARRRQPSGFEVTTHGGRRGTGLDAVEWAARVRRARRRRDPAQLDGRRRHQGRLRPGDDRGGPGAW